MVPSEFNLLVNHSDFSWNTKENVIYLTANIVGYTGPFLDCVEWHGTPEDPNILIYNLAVPSQILYKNNILNAF